MNRLWRRRVSKELFVVGWALILYGIFSFALGVAFIIKAAM